MVGDGLEGLACAHYLQRAGVHVALIAAAEPGRELAGRFTHGSAKLERFHAPIRPTDTALIGLIHDLGAAHRLLWRRCTSALREAPASGRTMQVTAALARAWITRFGRYARDFDRLGARSWLCAHAGERVFEESLEPLLRAHLGEIDDDVPAATAWRALVDIGEAGERRVGYLRGGTSGLLDALRQSLRGDSVERVGEALATSWLLRPNGAELRREGASHPFDAVVSTVPSSDAGDAAEARLDTLVSVALVTRSVPSLAYRTVCADPALGSATCHRSDLIVPLEDTSGYRVLYFTRRARAGQPVEPHEVLQKQARECLRGLVPDAPLDIEAALVSTARVPAPQQRGGGPARSALPEGPLFPGRAEAHASGAGADLESAVQAARTTAERVLGYLARRG